MNSFPKSAVLAACVQFGHLLSVPQDLDGAKLMYAIASNESSLGLNCGPRHEPAYDAGGSMSTGKLQASLLSEYGSAAACSYGPWQLMFCNCPRNTPSQLLSDIEASAQAFVAYFNDYVIRSRNARTLSEIGQVYNGGHIFTKIPPGVATYCERLQEAYDAAVLPTQDQAA